MLQVMGQRVAVGDTSEIDLCPRVTDGVEICDAAAAADEPVDIGSPPHKVLLPCQQRGADLEQQDHERAAEGHQNDETHVHPGVVPPSP